MATKQEQPARVAALDRIKTSQAGLNSSMELGMESTRFECAQIHIRRLF